MSISLDKLRLLRRQAGDTTQTHRAVVDTISVASLAGDSAKPADDSKRSTAEYSASATEASRLTSLLQKPVLPAPVQGKPTRNDSAIAWVEQIQHKSSHNRQPPKPMAEAMVDVGIHAVVGATSVAGSIGRSANPASASARATEDAAALAAEVPPLMPLLPTRAPMASNPQRSTALIAPRRIQDSASLRRLLGLRERAIGSVPTAMSRATALDRTIPGEEIAPGLFLIESFLPQSIPNTALSLAFAKRDDEQLDPRDLLFFDTETTGLAGGTGTRAFMIGAADWHRHDIHGQGLRIRQLLMTTMAAETAMLREFAGWLRPTTVFSSYNGRCYDAPLLKTRYRLARQPDPISALDHVDLLFPTRRRYRGVWENCRLATIERQLLKIVREDDLPGSEAPAAWLTYLRGGSARNLRRVADHNHQDVVTLAQLFLRLVKEQRSDESRVDLQLPV